LIDPHRRAIYDSVGTKGLGKEGQQIVIRSKTPKEIREEYEKLAKEREEMHLEKLTFSEVCCCCQQTLIFFQINLSQFIFSELKGNFSMGLDMTNIFDDKYRFEK
jgi:hypothetical protein